jgi:hypothetical protein
MFPYSLVQGKQNGMCSNYFDIFYQFGHFLVCSKLMQSQSETLVFKNVFKGAQV